MVKPENNAPPAPRLTKGQKANRKRMATVAAVFTRQPWIRTPAQVIESLFRSRSKEQSALLPTPPRPENKRVWASLTKGKAAVIDEVIAEMQRRDPEGSKTRLALTDGERALQTLVDQKLGVSLILDFIHVLEKLWKAAFVFHREGSLEAEVWVLDRALRVLSGGVSQDMNPFTDVTRPADSWPPTSAAPQASVIDQQIDDMVTRILENIIIHSRTSFSDDEIMSFRNELERAGVHPEGPPGTVRKSGEPYIFHPLQVAVDMSDNHMGDLISIVGCLLHDVVEDTVITEEEMNGNSGSMS